ncbi:MAG: efflux RND transporter periplasmic adaptor subunit [Pirellulales bacterium]
MSSEVDIKRLAIVRDRAASAARPSRRRHVVSRYLIPGVLLAGFLSLVAWSARDLISPPRAVWVVPVLASHSAVESEGTPLFQAAGWVEPRPTAIRVAALTPGVVERLLVVEDQAVKAGEPVAELVKADAELARDGAEAELALRQAEQAEAAANLDAASAVYNAKQGSTGVVAARAIQEAKSARDASKAKLAAAEAQVAQARVALAMAKLRLERTTVRAPVDGRVYQLMTTPGSTLSGGMGPGQAADSSTVVTMYQPQMLQIRADVRFEDIPKVSLRQKVTINNPALAEPIAGQVLFVSSKANIQKNTLEVKVALDQSAAVLKPEMLVEVTYLAPKVAADAGQVSEAMRLYVPQQLVERAEGGAYLWVADQSAGVARQTAVTLGTAAPGGLVEVAHGLDMGSRIIARGGEGLVDGQRIRVVSEDAAALATATADAADSHPMHRLPQQGE